MGRIFENVRATFDELANIQPGEKVVYHTGAALPQASAGSQSVAAFARELYLNGRVHLVQRRIKVPCYQGAVNWHAGVGEFEYLAIGTKNASA